MTRLGLGHGVPIACFALVVACADDVADSTTPISVGGAAAARNDGAAGDGGTNGGRGGVGGGASGGQAGVTGSDGGVGGEAGVLDAGVLGDAGDGDAIGSGGAPAGDGDAMGSGGAPADAGAGGVRESGASGHDGAGGDAAPCGIYVSPTGADDNPGTLAEPRRSIALALASLGSCDTVWLLDGVFDESTQPEFASAVGGFDVPAGKTIAAVNLGGAVLRGTAAFGVRFPASGGLRGTTIEGIGLEVTAGHVEVADVAFESFALALRATGTSELVVERAHFTGPAMMLHVTDFAKAHVTDSLFEGDNSGSNAVEASRESELLLESSRFSGAGLGFTGLFAGSATIQHVEFFQAIVNPRLASDATILFKEAIFVESQLRYQSGLLDVEDSVFDFKDLAVMLVPTAEGGRLRVRNSKFRGNGYAVQITDYESATASRIDFGAVDDPGGNSFVTSTYAAMAFNRSYVTEVRTIFAVGNTWEANVQGADASGHYMASGPGAVYEVAGPSPGPPDHQNFFFFDDRGRIRLAENPL